MLYTNIYKYKATIRMSSGGKWSFISILGSNYAYEVTHKEFFIISVIETVRNQHFVCHIIFSACSERYYILYVKIAHRVGRSMFRNKDICFYIYP